VILFALAIDTTELVSSEGDGNLDISIQRLSAAETGENFLSLHQSTSGLVFEPSCPQVAVVCIYQVMIFLRSTDEAHVT
jgi:hypothetical protein